MSYKMEKDLLRDAQYRKGLSIAFFNATNASIEMMKATSNVSIENFRYWRDLFLQEHAEYYANVISKVGSNFDPKVTIGKLQGARSMEELRSLWLNISEDERQNAEIKKIAYTLRASFTKKPLEAPKVATPKAKKKND